MAYSKRVAALFPFDMEMQWDELYPRLVAAFGTRERQVAWAGFTNLCERLKELGLPADVFIGGPFLTTAPGPEDIMCAVAVLAPLEDISEAQGRALAELARTRDSWLVRQHCDFDLFLDEGDDGDLLEMIDRWLNSTCSNALGPPIRAVKVKLCQ